MQTPTISRARVNGFRLECQSLSPCMSNPRSALAAAGWLPSGRAAYLVADARISHFRPQVLEEALAEGYDWLAVDTVRGSGFFVPRAMAAAVLRSPSSSQREAAERALNEASVPFAGRETVQWAVVEALSDGPRTLAQLKAIVRAGTGSAEPFLRRPGVLPAVLTILRLDGRVFRSAPLDGSPPVFRLAESVLDPEELGSLSPKEALRILCAFYYRVHGPATRADFGWWSGAGRVEVAEAFAAHVPNLRTMRIEGLPFTFYLPPSRLDELISYERTGSEPVTLVPARDPWLTSHEGKVGRFVRPEDLDRLLPGGVAKPAILLGGTAVGTFRIDVETDQVTLEWFRSPAEGIEERGETEADRIRKILAELSGDPVQWRVRAGPA